MQLFTVQPVLELSDHVEAKLYTTAELAEIWDVSLTEMIRLTQPLQTLVHGERRQTIFSDGVEIEQFHWNRLGRDAVARLFS